MESPSDTDDKIVENLASVLECASTQLVFTIIYFVRELN